MNINSHANLFRFLFFSLFSSSATELISRRGVFSRRNYGSTDQVRVTFLPPTPKSIPTSPAQNKRINFERKGQKEEQKQINSESLSMNQNLCLKEIKCHLAESADFVVIRAIFCARVPPAPPSALVPESICCGRNVNHRVNQ